MAVYPDSIVNQFVVDDGHVANPISSFQVRGVYPSYFVASVCGETCCGDHVAFGVPGTRALSITAGFKVGDGHYVGGTGVQFGTPTPVNIIVQTRTVSGVPTAQAFGTPAIKATFLRSVGSVLSAQLFGTVQFRVSALTGGVSTAQQFGVPTAKAGTVTRSVTGLGSAGAFGTPSAKTITYRTVGSVASAQAFGTPTVKASYKLTPTGLGSAQFFGVPTVKTAVTRTVTGLGSAQSFGAIRAIVPVRPGGVGSAANFGVPTGKAGTVLVPVPGLGSAQGFGTPTIPQRVSVPGVRGSSAYTDSIVDTFRVDDGHYVGAESSVSYFGTPWVGHLWLLEIDCIESPAPAICGAICGLTICGGESFTELGFCYGESAIVNTFICGQMHAGELGASFLDAGYASTVVDQFQVDDGHVVDGQFDSCLDSPLPAICDPATLCGTVVCGGASYISEIDCLLSPDSTIVNEFICGQRYVGGRPYNPPITVTRTIDLQPAGCL